NFNTNVIDFHPTPFGNDFFVQYGDDYSMPVVGNFDPPVTGGTSNLISNLTFNTKNPYDVDANGAVNVHDLFEVLFDLQYNGQRVIDLSVPRSPFVDVTQDGRASVRDLIAVFHYLVLQNQTVGEGESFDAVDHQTPVNRESAVVDCVLGDLTEESTLDIGYYDIDVEEEEDAESPRLVDAVFLELYGE
ncbi:MAG: hypothetical protein ABGZ53_10195, partial [Fuerstiella sp.]